MKKKTLALLLTFGVLLSGACTHKNHDYRPPQGVGAILYSPDRGIYREGDRLSREVEGLWYQAKIAYENEDYDEARDLLRTFRYNEEIVDSSRAFDAIFLESEVELERGRRGEDRSWRLHDLANAWLDGELPEDGSTIPSELLVDDSLREMHALGKGLSGGGYVENSWKIQEIIFEHYTYALGIAPSKMNALARQMRNLAWFAYLGEEYNLAINISKALIARSPRIDLRSKTQVILAQSYLKEERAKQAVDVYAEVFDSARDPDLREEALLGQVEALIASSKGWEYNREPYELALQKITEYKTGFLTLYRDPKLTRSFSSLERTLHDVLYNKDIETAKTYKRLLRRESEAFYRRIAGERRDTQLKTEENLRRAYRPNEEDNASR